MRSRRPTRRKLVNEADASGFDAVFSAESWGNDAFTPARVVGVEYRPDPLGHLGGSDVGPYPDELCDARPHLDHLSGGRAILGLVCRARRSSRAGTDSRSRSRSPAPVSTFRSCARSSHARLRCGATDRTTRCPTPVPARWVWASRSSRSRTRCARTCPSGSAQRGRRTLR